jgi:hypothetical protein
MCGAVLFSLSGGRWFDIRTPSMGEAAPVGSLILTSPVQRLSELRAGDVIAYNDGDGEGRVVTHRVVAIGLTSVTTRGDINSANDPNPVILGQIRGRQIAAVVGAGWLLRAVPFVATATVLLALLTVRVKDWLHRRAVWVVGESLALAVVVLVVHPLVGVQEVARSPRSGSLAMTFVSTGLLPVRVSADSGAHADLTAGQVGTVESTAARSDGRFWFVPALHLDWGGWTLLLLAASVPTLLLLWWGRAYARKRAVVTPESAARALLAALLVTLVAIGAGLGLSSGASFAAGITTTNSAGARTFFTCRSAESSTSGVFLAYAMGTSALSEPDLSGHGYTGSYSLAPTTTASDGCLRDVPSASARFDGLTTCLNTPDAALQTNPNLFSLEAWFSTTSVANGKILGFSNAHGTLGLFYDRHIYLDPAGRLVFGVNSGGTQIAASPAGTSFADGAWHHVVATLAPDGMRLYADGALVASNPAITAGQNYSGYWEIGCGPLGGWETGSGGAYLLPPSVFNGSIEYAAVYSTALTSAQVLEHYLAGAP